ncbi:hypothetical protein [Vibrio lentus]|uniref:hypothetical protein n=1 Tax=Vibrio lentus TaxID=136468 RepID=UPI000C81D501|nr:hypothetical protein [Vibrio lentus]PMJ59440.1 hypothetical protein BCU18_10210 [Vibrio lentus]PMM60258.1 hypothetical protein BCT51_03790 [Vibrio lentus]
MSFDGTAFGILVSVCFSIAFACLEFYKRGDFKVNNVALVFLAVYAISSGCELIFAALHGDPNNLPSSWREYISVAGMVGIGLSLNYVINAVKEVLVSSSARNSENATGDER